ncbi:MAG: hypothetical protein ACYCQI_14520 [Gammaproteobacteria bacterium]
MQQRITIEDTEKTPLLKSKKTPEAKIPSVVKDELALPHILRSDIKKALDQYEKPLMVLKTLFTRDLISPLRIFYNKVIFNRNNNKGILIDGKLSDRELAFLVYLLQYYLQENREILKTSNLLRDRFPKALWSILSSGESFPGQKTKVKFSVTELNFLLTSQNYANHLVRIVKDIIRARNYDSLYGNITSKMKQHDDLIRFLIFQPEYAKFAEQINISLNNLKYFYTSQDRDQTTLVMKFLNNKQADELAKITGIIAQITTLLPIQKVTAANHIFDLCFREKNPDVILSKLQQIENAFEKLCLTEAICGDEADEEIYYQYENILYHPNDKDKQRMSATFVFVIETICQHHDLANKITDTYINLVATKHRVLSASQFKVLNPHVVSEVEEIISLKKPQKQAEQIKQKGTPEVKQEARWKLFDANKHKTEMRDDFSIDYRSLKLTQFP